MTRERDRIQENANKYKVLNCPAYNDTPNMYDEIYGYCDNEHDIDLDKCMCENITNCVIKQVIEKCKYIIDDDICLECNKFERGLDCFECDYDGHREDIMRGISRVSLAKQILQLFDIEEINK
jgi:hypothetical protein